MKLAQHLACRAPVDNYDLQHKAQGEVQPVTVQGIVLEGAININQP
jgi:hypothetical protein